MTLLRPSQISTEDGADGDVLTIVDGVLVPAPPAEPTGGGETVTWTKLLDANPMTSLSGFTSRSGTWTVATPTYGVQETATPQDAWLECNIDLSGYSYRAIQAVVRNNGSGITGFGFASSGGWGNNNLAVGYDEGGNHLWYDKYGVGSANVNNQAFDANTDYTIMVVEKVQQSTFWVYLNGVRNGIINTSGINLGRVGLYTRFAGGWFRNVTVWGGQENWSPPT